MHPTLVLNVVGLTPQLLGKDTPHLSKLAQQGGLRPLATITPAVTCSVQASFTTGLLPSDHGIVGNGWYFRDLSEVWFWRQSNRLVAGEKIWETASSLNSSFTCAKLFWWYNMYSSADYTVTPRPMYPADGQKIPDIYTQPSELRTELNARFGRFPLFRFWGPAADLVATRWIADCAAYIYNTRKPTLTLVYLPLLDYNLQRFGPNNPAIRKDLYAIDNLCGELIEQAHSEGTRIVVLSEYGITDVTGPVHINRTLRDAGLIHVRVELGRELLDCGASEAFAVVDHQIAHVYVRSPDRIKDVKDLLQYLPGVETVLDKEGQERYGLNHPRSGELVAITKADRWFTYYYWLDDSRAPDFARTVDIHRKPGYDPVELFLSPALIAPKLRIAARLIQKNLGFRTLMDVIGLDATLPRGSHGRATDRPEAGPLLISSEPDLIPKDSIPASHVRALILRHVFGRSRSWDESLEQMGEGYKPNSH